MYFINNTVLKAYIWFETFLAFGCITLIGCVTLHEKSYQLPDGYSLVQDSSQKYSVKCPDGYVTDCQWLTKDGAIGYAMSYDASHKKSH